MILWELFLSFLQIGTFSFGGGYAAVPLIQDQVVNIHQWISMGEFTDLITISQMTPGPIAINSATFVGLRVAGMPGAVIATLGCILPSCIIVSILAYVYLHFRKLDMIQGILGSLRPAVIAMIAVAGLDILISSFWMGGPVSADPSSVSWAAVAIFAAAMLLLRKWKQPPIRVMLICGLLGLFFL